MTTTVGILGAGQLALMLAQAAKDLELSTLCLAKDPSDCAGQVSELLVDPHHDLQRWDEFCQRVDLLTLETENLPLDMAEYFNQRRPLLPNLNALAISQDRGHEKATFNALGIPTAPYVLVDSQADLNQAIETLGYPLVLKTRRFGYDGKGQYVLRSSAEADAAWAALEGQALIAEGFVQFQTEVSLIGARSILNEVEFYPLVENTHTQGILRQTVAPYENEALTAQAQQYLHLLMEHLDYRGVLAVEFFLKDGTLIANEMAPRVHNTGHWTIEGTNVSQFEQHLRAITGLPLKPVVLHGASVMLNCIGALPDPSLLAQFDQVYFHDYGKPPQPMRKVGHLTLVRPDLEEALKISRKISALLAD